MMKTFTVITILLLFAVSALLSGCGKDNNPTAAETKILITVQTEDPTLV